MFVLLPALAGVMRENLSMEAERKIGAAHAPTLDGWIDPRRRSRSLLPHREVQPVRAASIS
jgi:ABC-type taurine transport system substrate-binding protein